MASFPKFSSPFVAITYSPICLVSPFVFSPPIIHHLHQVCKDLLLAEEEKTVPHLMKFNGELWKVGGLSWKTLVDECLPTRNYKHPCLFKLGPGRVTGLWRQWKNTCLASFIISYHWPHRGGMGIFSSGKGILKCFNFHFYQKVEIHPLLFITSVANR